MNNNKDQIEISILSSSDSGKCTVQFNGSTSDFDPSAFCDPQLTETTIGNNDWDCDNEKCEPLLNSKPGIEIKRGISSYGDDENLSLSIHDLYTMDEERSTVKDVQLTWKNVSYDVKSTNWGRQNKFPWFKLHRNRKVILQNQSGCLKTGDLTAVIGPSGAGKSTLLECLSGRRRTRRKGDILVCIPKDEIKKASFNSINDIRDLMVSFIGQKDYLIGVLTVRESLLFASKLKNYREERDIRAGNKHFTVNSKVIKNSDEFHAYVVQTVLTDFGLDGCRDVLVNKCSGGQAKRLSIALELVSKPKILILDEPTSGLDSSSALQCIQVLKKLTLSKDEKLAPLAIIASIHQPSARLLYSFENTYVLSNDGRCLYQGSVANLLSHLTRFGLKCPQFHNPGDFIIEVTTAVHGTKCMDELASFEKNQQEINFEDEYENLQKYKITHVVDKMTKQEFPFLCHSWLLLRRTWMNTIREPMLTWLRLFQHLLVGSVASFMYSYAIGEPNGCFSELTDAFAFNASSIPSSIEEVQEKFIHQQSISANNAAFMFFSILFLAFANSSSTVLTFPLEMSVFVKERRNAWYSCGTYFIAKLLADTPFQVVIPIIFSALVYTATHQIMSWWRFWLFSFICILTASISQSVGILFGIMFLENLGAAVFMSTLSLTPFFLLGGFLITYSGVSNIFKPIALLSYVRYSFESLVVIIYGFDRCDSDQMESKVSDDQSWMANLACAFGSQMKNSQFATAMSELKSANFTSEYLEMIFDIERSCATKLVNQLHQMRKDYEDEAFDTPANNTPIIDSEQTTSSSYMMMHFELEDNTLWRNLIILGTFILVLRIISYLLLLYKTNKKLKE